MNSVFADTAFFVAYVGPRDKFHARSAQLMSTLQGRVVTTDWVLIELANYLARSKIRPRVAAFIRDLQSDARYDIVPASAAAIEEGLAFYERHRDKEWSLTDCISFDVMRREGITQALTADHHFEQAGFEILMKSE
jgi:predicted nucleic acid-binding protein